MHIVAMHAPSKSLLAERDFWKGIIQSQIIDPGYNFTMWDGLINRSQNSSRSSWMESWWYDTSDVNKFDVDVNGDGMLDFDGAGSRNASNSFSTMPKIKGRLGATYLFGDHSANVTMRYTDGYKNDQSNDGKVDSWTTVDAQYSVMLPGLLGDFFKFTGHQCFRCFVFE